MKTTEEIIEAITRMLEMCDVFEHAIGVQQTSVMASREWCQAMRQQSDRCQKVFDLISNAYEQVGVMLEYQRKSLKTMLTDFKLDGDFFPAQNAPVFEPFGNDDDKG